MIFVCLFGIFTCFRALMNGSESQQIPSTELISKIWLIADEFPPFFIGDDTGVANIWLLLFPPQVRDFSFSRSYPMSRFLADYSHCV